MKALDSYFRNNGLSYLPRYELTLGDLRRMVRAKKINRVIFDHLQRLNSIEDSEVSIVHVSLGIDEFNKLVFLDGFPTSELLSEGRTILQVARYVNKVYPSNNLDKLFSKNHWFDQVRTIYEDFDYALFDPLILAAPTINNEIEHGVLYLKDGCHRSLALGIKVNNEDFRYDNVNALVIYYNRVKYDSLL